MSRRIAEFDESDDALRFAKMKGADYTVCAGLQKLWAVRPKSRREIGLGDPFGPPDSVVDDYDGDIDE
jgi:hypothetical protein